MAHMQTTHTGHQQGSAGRAGGRQQAGSPSRSGMGQRSAFLAARRGAQTMGGLRQSGYPGRSAGTSAGRSSYLRQQWRSQAASQAGAGRSGRASAAAASPSPGYWRSLMRAQRSGAQAGAPGSFGGAQQYGRRAQEYTGAQYAPTGYRRDGARGAREGWRRWGLRWPWLYRASAGLSPQGQYTQQIQSCLQQILGRWVPQDGQMGYQTKLAIRTFQGLQRMPETGVLDAQTASAIQAACAAAPPPSAGAPPMGGPADAGAPDAGAPNQAAGADGTAPPDAGASPDAGPADGDAGAAAAAPGDDAGAAADGGADSPGELSAGEFERDGEQEFVLTGPCSIEARTQPRVPITPDLSGLASEPGVYIIYVNDQPWYVGVAEEGIRKRFLHRLKVLRDFRIPANVLQGRSVESIALIRATVGHQALSRRSPGGAASPVAGKNAILKVLEQLYIRNMRTGRKGNQNQERVIIDRNGGSLSIQVDGQPIRLPGQAF